MTDTIPATLEEAIASIGKHAVSVTFNSQGWIFSVLDMSKDNCVMMNKTYHTTWQAAYAEIMEKLK